jgi:TonB-linked SusC/RagA family outer membrane protein
MQIIAYNPGIPILRVPPKLLLIMKLTTFILIVALAQVSAKSLAQKITLDTKNTPIEKVIQSISQQSGYEIAYNIRDLNDEKISLKLNQASIEEAMTSLLKGLPLSFKIVKKNVVLTRKEPSFLDKLVGSITADRFDLIDVKGKVVNENNETLPGALIKVKGTNRAVVADAKGNFELYKIDDKAILVFSYIGYESQEVKAAPSMGYITLKPTTNALDQVVVQGYGTTTDRLRTGNIATVTKEIIEKQPVVNVIQALQGRVPGLVISQTSGYASAPFKVELRGRTAINRSMVTEPLYIIDGVPYDIINFGMGGSAENGSTGVAQNGITGPADGQSPLFSMNPNDIESISVLKDADALAIYGSKGANGVILITTKKGQVGKTKFDAEVNRGVSMVTQRYQMMNTQQYVAMRKEAFKNSGITPTTGNAADIMVWDTTRYTNLQNLYWGDPAQRLDVQFGLSGGEKTTTFRIGSSLLDMKDVNTYSGGNKRFGAQLNLNHKNLDQRLNISFNTFYTYVQSNLIATNGNPATPPNLPPVFDDQGKLNFAGYAPLTNYFQFGKLLEPYTSKTILLNANLKVQYQLAKGLNISTSLGYNTQRNSQMYIRPIVAQNPEYNPTGTLDIGVNNKNSLILEPQVDYKLSIGKGELSLLAGATFQKSQADGSGTYGSGYVNDNLLKSISNAPVVYAQGFSGQYNYSGVFARANYNYQNKYLVNLSARRDGSTRFGPGNQFGNFGSFGVAWIFTEESWLKNNLPVLSFGKLRASYGLTGSDNISDYQFLSRWNTYQVNYQNNAPAYNVIGHFNPDLKWQTDRKLDIGLSLAFFKDRLNLEVSVYRNRIGNQLLNYLLPNITGFNNVTTNLDATVQNKGVENTINARIIETADWGWTAHFNMGINRNTLLEYKDLEKSPYASVYTIGKPLALTYTLESTGVDTQTGEYTFKDFNGDGIIDASVAFTNPISDRKIVIDRTVRFEGGFGTAVRYRAFTLDLSFHYRRQNIKRGWTTSGIPGAALNNMPIEIMDRWQKAGDNARFAKYTVTNTTSYGQFYSDADVLYQDMYFIRLNNAVLSYNLPEKWMKKIGVKAGKIYVRGQNLLTITNYEGLDPEVPIFGRMPTLFTLMGGLQLNF